MRRVRSLVVPSILGAFAAAACATSGDLSNGACAPNTYDYDGDPSNGCEYKCTMGPNAPNDPIDAQFVDENCDGTDGVVAKLVFVASDGTDAPNAGTRQAPMKTLAFAIHAAQQQGKDVAVSGETYTGEVDMLSGVSLYGGFNEHLPAFAFRRDGNTNTTLTTKGTVVLASSIDVETRLQGFVINAAAPDPPMTGLGTYGVRLLGGLGTLVVKDNNITTEPGQDGAKGQDGSDGNAGTNGPDGADGCNGCGTSIPPNGGSLGGPAPTSPCGGTSGGAGGQGGYDQSGGLAGGNGSGANSQGGAGGSGGSTCPFTGGGNGANGGTPSENGTNGVDAAAAAAKGTLDAAGTYVPPVGGTGQPGAAGNAGGGGGGGGGGTSGGGCNGDRGSGGGAGGTGGCGGTPGTSATGGGASFGILARAGKLVAGNNRITAGRGGNGGAGGKGGAGGAGGKGGAGKGRNDDGGSSGSGGNGTRGGVGGNGAGGTGGPSACIATGSGVVLDETPINQCSPAGGGSGGAGGNAASNAGPAGLSSPVLLL